MIVDVACAACNAPVQVEVHPPSLANVRGVSLLIVTHDMVVGCPHCRATLMPEITGVPGIAFRTVPVPSQPTGLILPGRPS